MIIAVAYSAWALYVLALVLATVLDTDRYLWPPRRRGGPSPATPPVPGRRRPFPLESEEPTVLVLKRKEGQWVDVTHRSGDVLRIRVCQVEAGQPGHLNLAFDDSARNFAIERPERAARRASAPEAS